MIDMIDGVDLLLVFSGKMREATELFEIAYVVNIVDISFGGVNLIERNCYSLQLISAVEK